MLSLSDFLKKYSTISNKFIDDFFSLYDYKTNENDLVIDFDNLCNWLMMRKDVLKRTLERTYIKDIDYKIKIIKLKGKGRPYEKISITPNCMKRICMLSTTKKAEEIRTYYIKIEKLIDKYKEIIIDELNKKIGILEKNQKNNKEIKGGVIYVLRTDLDIEGIYKIGKTKIFKNRIKTHNSSHVDNVEVVFIFETNDIDGVEKCLKLALKTKQYRKRKEFYQVDLDLLKELMNDCENLLLKGKNKPNKNIKGGNIYMMFNY